MYKKFHKILHLPLSKIPISFYFISFIVFMNIIMIVRYYYNVHNEPYFLTHHFLTYDLGFIPKALYGSTIGLLTQVLPFHMYNRFWLLFILFSHCIFIILYLTIRKNNLNKTYVDLIMLFAVSLPTTALPIVDYFSFEIVNYDLFLICAILCWKKNPLRFIVPPLIIAMILIHEASLFMFIPTIIGVIIYRLDYNKKDYLFLGLIFMSCLIGASLFYVAKQTPLVPSVVDSYLQSRCSYSVKLNYHAYLDNIANNGRGYLKTSIEDFWKGNNFFQILFALPFVSLAVLVFIFYWRRFFDVTKQSGKVKTWLFLLLLLSTASNLCLFIGPDYNRWVASTFSVHLFLILMLLHEHKNHPLPPISQKNKLFIILLCFLLIQIGPGYFLPFSDFTRILAERFTCYLLK